MNAEKTQSQGFDIIIGNPPYIDYRKIDGKTKTSLSETSSVYKKSKEGSIYVYFLERFLLMLADKGNVSFINPIAYICQDSGKGIRTFIDNNLTLKQMLDVSNIKVFENSATYTCVNIFSHKNKRTITKYGQTNDKDISHIQWKPIQNEKIENLSVFLDSISAKIFNANYPKLSDFCRIFCGLSKAGFRADVSCIPSEINRKFLESSNIFKYSFKNAKFIDKIKDYYTQEKINIFEKQELIFMARMTDSIRCCITPNGYFGGKVNVLYQFNIDRKYILGILNSRLMSYFYAKKYFASHMQGGAFGFDTLSVGSLPIPQITDSNRHIADKIIALVEAILAINAPSPTPPAKGGASICSSSVAGDFSPNSPSIKKGNSALIPPPSAEGVRGSGESHTSQSLILQRQIDSLVYQLYNLNSKEIAIIESAQKAGGNI